MSIMIPLSDKDEGSSMHPLCHSTGALQLAWVDFERHCVVWQLCGQERPDGPASAALRQPLSNLCPVTDMHLV